MAHANKPLAVGFATCGRAAILAEAITQLRLQSTKPDHVFVCYTVASDIAGLVASRDMTFIKAEPGLPRQRNAILDAAGKFGTMLFLDDDFLIEARYIETVARVFAGSAGIAIATGTPYADDVKGPGLSVARGLAIIAEAGPQDLDLRYIAAAHGYGCNMAVNLVMARAENIRFDERLPLYGWSEDVDFSHRLGKFGRIVKLSGARGVHLGVKSGRSSGRRLGYSQIANPLYLLGKGSYSWRRAAGSIARNLAANSARAAWSEPYIDRRGRLRGNVLALADLLRGRLQPERVLDL
jgi:GT2 family glycosyltransferase